MSSRSLDVYRSMSSNEMAQDRRFILKKLSRHKKSQGKSIDNNDDEDSPEEYQDPNEGFDSIDQTLRGNSFRSQQSFENKRNDKYTVSKNNFDFPKSESPKKRLISILYILITLAIIIAFVFFLEATKLAPYAISDSGKSQTKIKGTNSNTGTYSQSSPLLETEEVTADDNSERITLLKSILGPDISPLDKLSSRTTAQYSALHWLADKDKRKVDIPKSGIETQKLIQRYILAVIYYSTHGKGWSRHLNFLSENDECDWNVLDEEGFFAGAGACDENGLLTTLALWNNNLHGTIPNEIGHLFDLKVLSLSSNHLYGELPSAMISMNNLERVFVQKNKISGHLSFLCGKPNLLKFHSDCDDPSVECECCDMCCSTETGHCEKQTT